MIVKICPPIIPPDLHEKLRRAVNSNVEPHNLNNEMTSEAAEFFAWIVKPTVSEFLANPQDIRRGRLAAIVLNHMADYLALDGYRGHERSEMDSLLKAVRERLTGICPDFSLIRDIADATKHAKLSVPKKGPPRDLSSSQQITRSPGMFEAPFSEGVFGETVMVFATLNDGTVKPLQPAINSVMAALEEQLAGIDCGPIHYSRNPLNSFFWGRFTPSASWKYRSQHVF